MKADTPDRNTKVGAQKCVMKRVKNIAGVVVFRSTGLLMNAGQWKKSRTWSIAMINITAPLRISIEPKRGFVPVMVEDICATLQARYKFCNPGR